MLKLDTNLSDHSGSSKFSFRGAACHPLTVSSFIQNVCYWSLSINEFLCNRGCALAGDCLANSQTALEGKSWEGLEKHITILKLSQTLFYLLQIQDFLDGLVHWSPKIC